MLDVIRKRAVYLLPIGVAVLVMYALLAVLPAFLSRVAPSLAGYSTPLAWVLANFAGIALYAARGRRTGRERPSRTRVSQPVTG